MNERTKDGRVAGQPKAPTFKPLVSIPAILIPQPDGSYQVKAGRPVIEGETVSTRRAAQLLGLSQSQVCRMVEAGVLEAYRPGKRWLRVKLSSVLARKERET